MQRLRPPQITLRSNFLEFVEYTTEFEKLKDLIVDDLIQHPELPLFSVELTDYLEGLDLHTYQEFGWFCQIVKKVRYYNAKLASVVTHNIVRAITSSFDN